MEHSESDEGWRGVIVISLLTFFALLVHGYHPYAEDGGLYVAGIKKVLDPHLYPVWTEFVTEHLRFSLFAPMVADLVWRTHLELPWVLLALYCGSIWLTLYAAWMIAERCVWSFVERCGAVTLLACWLTLPIAGTSLMLMDPYTTARSLSTPLTLLALAGALDVVDEEAMRKRVQGALLCVLAIVAAAVMHPLMAGYGLGAVLMLLCVGSQRKAVRQWGPFALCGVALVTAAVLQSIAPTESAAYVRVAMTRYYWFLFQWRWYEQIGLAAPLLLVIILGRHPSRRGQGVLARMAVAVGASALLVAAVFSRAGMSTHLVARLQPLRSFQIVYEVMTLLLGAWLAKSWLKRRAWRWGVLLAGLGGFLFVVQSRTFPASDHLEWPWRPASNPWVRAFVWAQQNTPASAVFALDAHYITQRGEDAQSLRSISERSALPDFSKDGGEASITPDLTADWVKGQAAQTGLEQASDAERISAVRPLGATWVVLQGKSKTAWNCPYKNESVKVCQLP